MAGYRTLIKLAKENSVKTDSELRDLLFLDKMLKYNVSGGEYESAKKELKII